MTQRLNLRVSLGSRQREYPLQYNLQEGEARLSITTILRHINRFLSEQHYIVANYLNIWVVTPNGKENLYKLRRNGSYIPLTLNQNSAFEIRILLQDIEDKQNLLKFFHSNSEQFNRLNSNINRIIQQSKEEEKRGQKCLRPIDIAYFFADPLVTVSQKNKITINHEVSYQLEYDKFIELVKKQEFLKNFRIEMMVATKTNIKNTLFDGASVLHFACHGKKPNGNLQIQSETSIGELLNLQHQQFMNLLDIRTALPKLIIFNVCYSHTLAQKVSSSKNIICIGYNDEASDVYCERFTREFYMGLFKRRESVRELFHKIKNQIIEDQEREYRRLCETMDPSKVKKPCEGKKLCIFPQEPFPNEETQDFFGNNSEQKFNYYKRWTPSEGLRENDILGVKSEMFTFIKQYLTNNERISYFFLKGEKLSGKSDFMKKTRIYIMDRKVFTQDFTVDLKDKDRSYIETLLQLRLEKEDLIARKMNELRQLSKERKTNPIIIFDHSEKILKIQYSKFVEYVQNKFMKQLRYGKVVIVTNNITPIREEEAENFKKAYFHAKEPPNIEPKELENYITRYASEDVKQPAYKYCTGRFYPYLKLVKAIKRSRSEQELAENCQTQQPASSPHNYQSISLEYIQCKTREFQRSLQQIHECATIKIQDNDHVFLSTIFLEVDLEEAQHYTSLSCMRNDISRLIEQLTADFTAFVKGIFKVYKHEQRMFNDMKHKIPMRMIFHLSFAIAAFLYIFRDFRLFERHLLNCEKLYVLISGFFLEELKRQNEFQETVTQYHLKLLLTLYSYYSQNQHLLGSKSLAEERTNEEKENEGIFRRKAEIIMDEILTHFDRHEYQHLLHALKNVFLINQMVQELHYNKNYNLFVQNERRQRKESQRFDLSNEEGGVDVEEQAALIDQQHEKIAAYWRTFLEIEVYSRKDSWSILRRESILLMEIAVLKHIVFNLRQFDLIFEKGESYLSQSVGLYIGYYILIMQRIHADGIFTDKEKNGLFRHHTSQAVKPLFQEYLKAFIVTYFELSKIKQNLSKEYSLPIFYQLLSLCQKSHYVSGISSIKKMIELHINEQFFNTWTCACFIALPLTYERAGADIKYNIKRFETHVYNFLHNFYENELDKEVKFEVRLMSEENLRQYEQEKRHLIQLVICDCTEESEKVYLESEAGKSVPCSIRGLPLPNAPIIIYFGANVRHIEQVYNKKKSIAIWINIDQKDKDRELMLEKQRNLGNIEAVSNLLGVYYNVLEYFYCSFCRHFFNGTHQLFTEQVKYSFDLAKAETMIKTKMLYSTHREFHNQREIQQAIDQIDCNLQYLMESAYGPELIRKPAYHFIYRQSKNDKPTASTLYQITNRTWELGCNYEICELLMELGQIKFQRLKEVNIIIYYKSQPMLSFFLSTLRIKLLKMGGYIVNRDISREEYSQYRNALNNKISRSSLTEMQEYSQDDTTFLTPFLNLEQPQFSAQLASLSLLKNTNIRLFFTRSKYGSLSKVYRKLSIQEHPKTNKVEFDYYFLYCRKLRPNASQKKVAQVYKEMANQNWSLLDVKTAIQRL